MNEETLAFPNPNPRSHFFQIEENQWKTTNQHLHETWIRVNVNGEVEFLLNLDTKLLRRSSQDLQSRLYSETKSSSTHLAYLPQAQQNISSNNMQNIIISAGVQSPGFPSVPLSGITQAEITVLNRVGQSCILQNISENLVGYSVPQCEHSNIISNSPRLMQVREHTQQIDAQQLSQNVQQYIYQTQLENQILDHTHYGNNQPLLMQSHIQHNQQHQNISQPPQLQSSQQSDTHTLQGHQLSPPTLQQNQLIGQHCSILDTKQQQQENQHWVEHEQSIISRMQQQHKQLLDQQNDISNFRQQQLGPQHNVPETLQHSMHTLQQAKVIEERQKTQHTPSMSFFTHGQRSQSQLSQQQVMSQLLTHQAPFQQQLGSQNKANVLQRDMNQRMHASSFLQNQNTIEHQRQLFQFQRRSSEASSNSLAPNVETNVVDAHEAVHQKIKSMKELYMPLLLSIHKRVINLLNSRVQTTDLGQIERYHRCRAWVESTLRMLNRPPNPDLTEEKLLPMERQIIDFIKFNRTRRNIFSQPQGQKQLQPSGAHSPQTQIPQLQHTDNQLSTLMQSKNLKNSVPMMQPNAALSFQHDSMPSLSSRLGGRTIQPSLVNTLQTSSDLESIPGSSMSSLQQGALGSLEKIPMNATQQHLKQQFHQRQLSHQLIQQQQEQQIIQQQHQQKVLQQKSHQQKQQQSTHILAHQIPQPYQMNEVSDMQGKQSMNAKLGTLAQHQTAGRQSGAYNHQNPLKYGPSFHISSPQHLQAASPRASQHSSPQNDQQSMISSSLSKSDTPLQPASSPIFSLSPPTSLAPSPMPGDHEKQNSSISWHSNAGNGRQKQTVTSGPQSQSLVIGTPGISASPFLAEFASPDNNQGTASTIISGKTSETEKPIDRLIKVVKSMSHKALSASASDIYSAVSMVDRIAISKPGYDSKDAVGEDLVATIEHCMLANNFLPEDGIVTTRNVKCYSSSMPLTVVSSDGSVIDSFKLSNGMETSDLESTATSRIKRPRVEVNQALLNEIKEINRRLVNTMVDISKEDNTLTSAVSEVGQGTIVNCSFTSFTSSPNQIFPVLPICLLIPSNYPNCSPVLLDKLPLELSKEPEDLLEKAKLRFSRSLRGLSQPMLLGDMVRSWDMCARAVILKYCVQNGGGDLSTRYGTWETV